MAADRSHEINRLLTVYPTVVEGRGAVYVSAPITTGRLLYRKRATRGSEATAPTAPELRAQIVEANLDRVKPLVRAARERFGTVIDPSGLRELEGWSQSDYHAFWAEVIARFVVTVVFADGWEYSNGCAFEFLTAHRTGARMLRADFSPLSIEDGRRMIQAAIAELRADGVSTDFLEQVQLTLAGDAARSATR